MHQKKHLSFSAMRKKMAERFRQIEDSRQEAKVDYEVHDCLMSAFAMMFFQDPSMLTFQRRLEDSIQQNNLKALFQVSSIPKDSQLRDVLDGLSNESIDCVFDDLFGALQRGKHLAQYKVLDGYYLVAIDGSEYFSSEKIHCPHCLVTKSKKKTRYHHQILQAAMVHPDKRQVIAFAPEPVANTDGTKKQDCEINAGKRLICDLRERHPKMKIIIGGDGLYSKQPFIDEAKKARMSFVLVAKPADHKILFEWVNELTQLGEGGQLTIEDQSKDRCHTYRWVNQVPLNGTKDADNVNFFEYQIVKDGKTTYRNSWVTDIYIDEKNIKELVRIGRARWKIENETFNTLKNQGYHIEHNYGHGKNNLSMIFFILNLLAFFFHQVFELTDPLYQKCRTKFSSRKEYWNQLRCTFRILIFRSWTHLLTYLTDPPMLEPP
ncbi:MAG: transposase [Desulfobacteraceae bacterium]|nr:transposase [Desulfobacteraceae bacterium]